MKKKYFSYFVLAFSLTFILSACLSQEPSVPTEPMNLNGDRQTSGNGEVDTNEDEDMNADVLNGHMGCQEGEVSIDGTCQVAENNNAQLFEQDLSQEVSGEDISYAGTSGYLAKPLEDGDYPGIVMIHEWWGLNDNIREMARVLAREGYVVFAVDLYGEEAATTSERAMELASSVRNNQEEALADMQIALEYLRNEEGVIQVGSIGWCFGGQQSLLLSLNEDVDSTVIYYGQLIDDVQELRSLNGPVLGIFGSEDTSISTSSVESFESALNEANIDNEIHIYDGVGHAFANPSGSNYAALETRDAWKKTVDFLATTLQ